jgi:hypothetical protein
MLSSITIFIILCINAFQSFSLPLELPEDILIENGSLLPSTTSFAVMPKFTLQYRVYGSVETPSLEDYLIVKEVTLHFLSKQLGGKLNNGESLSIEINSLEDGELLRNSVSEYPMQIYFWPIIQIADCYFETQMKSKDLQEAFLLEIFEGNSLMEYICNLQRLDPDNPFSSTDSVTLRFASNDVQDNYKDGNKKENRSSLSVGLVAGAFVCTIFSLWIITLKHAKSKKTALIKNIHGDEELICNTYNGTWKVNESAETEEIYDNIDQEQGISRQNNDDKYDSDSSSSPSSFSSHLFYESFSFSAYALDQCNNISLLHASPRSKSSHGARLQRQVVESSSMKESLDNSKNIRIADTSTVSSSLTEDNARRSTANGTIISYDDGDISVGEVSILTDRYSYESNDTTISDDASSSYCESNKNTEMSIFQNRYSSLLIVKSSKGDGGEDFDDDDAQVQQPSPELTTTKTNDTTTTTTNCKRVGSLKSENKIKNRWKQCSSSKGNNTNLVLSSSKQSEKEREESLQQTTHQASRSPIKMNLIQELKQTLKARNDVQVDSASINNIHHRKRKAYQESTFLRGLKAQVSNLNTMQAKDQEEIKLVERRLGNNDRVYNVGSDEFTRQTKLSQEEEEDSTLSQDHEFSIRPSQGTWRSEDMSSATSEDESIKSITENRLVVLDGSFNHFDCQYQVKLDETPRLFQANQNDCESDSRKRLRSLGTSVEFDCDDELSSVLDSDTSSETKTRPTLSINDKFSEVYQESTRQEDVISNITTEKSFENTKLPWNIVKPWNTILIKNKSHTKQPTKADEVFEARQSHIDDDKEESKSSTTTESSIKIEKDIWNNQPFDLNDIDACNCIMGVDSNTLVTEPFEKQGKYPVDVDTTHQAVKDNSDDDRKHINHPWKEQSKDQTMTKMKELEKNLSRAIFITPGERICRPGSKRRSSNSLQSRYKEDILKEKLILDRGKIKEDAISFDSFQSYNARIPRIKRKSEENIPWWMPDDTSSTNESRSLQTNLYPVTSEDEAGDSIDSNDESTFNEDSLTLSFATSSSKSFVPGMALSK